MKSFDLAMSINTRGTFLCSKLCIPHLKEAQNPHILTISPPLDLGGNPKVNWFARVSTGYTLAKYGMTLITHGLAGELEDYGIGCNTLWPRTVVATAAVQNLLGGDEAMGRARTPAVMGDAAYEILTSDAKQTTDRFWIDDEALAATGVTDFAKYRVDPKKQEHELGEDFFC